MAWIDVFNGDADGLCSLVQLRLAEPAESELVTGTKRDIQLLRPVMAGPGDCVTVLDISFDRNRAEVRRLLDLGARLRYFDHHFAGDIPHHPSLEAVIDTSANVCTSLLVNRHLGGRHVAWGVAGAFGDNLGETAAALAADAGFDERDTAALRHLGELLNYNSYGTRLEELHFHPASLFRRLIGFPDPCAVLTECVELRRLAGGFEADLAAARELRVAVAAPRAAVYLLPDAPWARRVIGTWANEVARGFPDRAHLFLCPDGEGTLTVSVRAARSRPRFAAEFCRRYPNGGGREAAAGINRFDPRDQDSLLREFCSAFG